MKELIGLISQAGILQPLPGYNVGLVGWVSIDEGEGGDDVAMKELLLLCGDRTDEWWFQFILVHCCDH